MTTTYVSAARTAVQDVWGSLSQPTSAGIEPVGSAVKSPDVAPSRRTGSASANSSAIHFASRTIQVVLRMAYGDKISSSRIVDILRAFSVDRRGSTAPLLIPHTRLSQRPDGSLVVETGYLSTESAALTENQVVNEVESQKPEHSQTAAEVRALTALPAATLASSLGVSREQYQRWLRGSAISTIRHGQLVYLHTIAADLTRKVGQSQAELWWRTPVANGRTPEELLRERRVDLVHKLVASVPDPQPTSGGVLQGLRVQAFVDEFEESDDMDDEEIWSPYTGSKGDE